MRLFYTDSKLDVIKIKIENNLHTTSYIYYVKEQLVLLLYRKIY